MKAKPTKAVITDIPVMRFLGFICHPLFEVKISAKPKRARIQG